LDLSLEPQGTGASTAGDASVLADIRYGSEHCRPADDPRVLEVGLPPLTTPLRELWRTSAPVRRSWKGGIGFASASGFLFAHVLVERGWVADPIESTHAAYARLLDLARTLGCPYPLRIWNLLSGIHEGSPSLPRYQAFCIGRERALCEAGLGAEQFPAATAVGAGAPGLLVYLLAGSRRGTPVENPRQVSAYRYPSRYGPRPPSFARALCYPASPAAHCFVSGTASVVGHESLHPRDLGLQLEETLANLDAILDRSGAGNPSLLKVFLRRAHHLGKIEGRLREWAPRGTPILYLRAEVCREELEIEIECVCGR
jgi:chorismate lyase/3-hydroxybenzoate synthase